MFPTTHLLSTRNQRPRSNRRDHTFKPTLQFLEERLAPTGAPELLVHDGSFPYSLTVADGGTIDFGIIPPAWTPSEKTLTFRNTGTANLTLTNVNPADLPAGFELVSNFTLTTVPPGGSSQLVLKLIPNITGNYSGSLSIANNDADEGPFDLVLTGRVTTDPPPVFRTLDMGDAGTTLTAGWAVDSSQGYQGEVHWITNGTGTQAATWEFTNLPSGYYRIWTTWPSGSPRPSNASYQVFDGTESRGTHTINQTFSPNDLSFDGMYWRDMGDAESFNGSLKVTLTDLADSGNIMADAIHIRRIHDLTTVATFISDDGDPTFSTVGTWTTGTGGGYSNDLHGSLPGSGADVARWQFNVSQGDYRVWTTWIGGTDRATNAPFIIKDAAIIRGEVAVNQQVTPSGFTEGGIQWQELGGPYTITTLAAGNLVVELTDLANGNVIADAIRVEQVGPAILSPEIEIQVSGTSITTGSTVNFGQTPPDTQVAKTFTVRNVGSEVLTLSSIDPASLPAGFILLANLGSTSLTTGQSTTFEVALQTSTEGNYGGTLYIASNDGDENPFTISLTGRVKASRDYGDAPNEYGTLESSDGPRHALGGNLYLGSAIDGELDGQPNTNATGDDLNGSPRDEDGVVDISTIVPGSTGWVKILVSQPGLLDAWIDFNRNSKFDHPSEHVNAGVSIPVVAGINTLPFTLPADASPGTTFVRMRLSSAGSLLPTGAAADGEVEDYQVTIASPVQYLDDGQTGFTKTGTWTRVTPAGYLGDVMVSAAGFGADTVFWTFNVTPGVYRVAATWTPGTNRATNTPYMIYDGANTRAAISVNQRLNPTGLVDAGRSWSYLGAPIHVGSGTLKVRMSDNANGIVIADAIRIERVGPASPEITVSVGGSNLAINGTVSFGTTMANVPVQKTFTVKNAGSATLNLTPINPANLPTGYELVANLGSTSLSPGASTTFVLQLRHAVSGPVTGILQFANNDSDENPFTFTLSGTITTVALLDDGSPGFTQAGVWTVGTGAGYLGDYRTNTRGTGADKANWTFTVAPGKYRVWTTWVPTSTRATNAPFTILDGGTSRGTVLVNQRLYPTGLYAVNRTWKQLGDFNVYTHQLQVRLTDLANGTVVADGVRIEYLGDFARLEGTGTDLAATHLPPLPVPNVAEGEITLDDDPTEGTGLPTVRNRMMVMLSDTATVGQVNTLLDSIQGKIIGSMPDIKTLIVGIPDTGNLTTLKTAITALEASPAVALAVQDVLLGGTIIAGASNPGLSWTWDGSPKVGGTSDGNWGMEAIRAPAMWNLTALGVRQVEALRQKGQKAAQIGILDNGFLDQALTGRNSDGINDHRDMAGLKTLKVDPLTNKLVPGSEIPGVDSTTHQFQWHGQHVAGIIGAVHNRDGSSTTIGVEGINPLANTCASTDWVAASYRNVNGSWNLKGALDVILEDLKTLLTDKPNLNVVNLSLGYNWPINPKSYQQAVSMVKKHGQAMSEIAKRFNQTVFVCSAGNDSLGTFVEREALYNSPFTYAALGPENKSANILVVEAADSFLAKDIHADSFLKADFSNVGGHVAAPGYDILSTVGDPASLGFVNNINLYKKLSGTSMAAPHVTGLVGFLQTLARGLGTDLTPEQIKNLVTDPQYTTKCWTNESVPDGVSQELPMLDAFASVLGLDAIRKDGKPVFVDNPIQKALVNVDDGSLDGNARVDTDDADKDGITTEAFTSVTGVNFAGIFKGDGRRGDLQTTIDMKDFRTFRDALLQVLYTNQTIRGAGEDQTAFSNVISLDGPISSVKRDLNEDGRVVYPGSGQIGYAEELYSRFDFNGSGKLDVAGRLMNPGPDGVAPFKIDPDTPVSGLNNPKGALRDIDVMVAPGIWNDSLMTNYQDMLEDRDNDGVVDFLYSADLHLVLEPDPENGPGLVGKTVTVKIESLKDGSPRWTSPDITLTIANTKTKVRQVVTVPLFGSRDVRVTVNCGGESQSYVYKALKYGQDQVVAIQPVSVTLTPGRVKEGTHLSYFTLMPISVKLSTDLNDTVGLKFNTANDSAMEGSDYVALADKAITLNRGAITGTVNVQVVADNMPESPLLETFWVTCDSRIVIPPPETKPVAPFQVVIPVRAVAGTIEDDDILPHGTEIWVGTLTGKWYGNYAFGNPSWNEADDFQFRVPSGLYQALNSHILIGGSGTFNGEETVGQQSNDPAHYLIYPRTVSGVGINVYANYPFYDEITLGSKTLSGGGYISLMDRPYMYWGTNYHFPTQDVRLEVVTKTPGLIKGTWYVPNNENPENPNFTLTRIYVSPLMTSAVAVGDTTGSHALTVADLAPVVDEARAIWMAATGSHYASLLNSVNFVVTDLPGRMLGLATPQGIYLDRDAAGWGWFIDRTPTNDAEFLLQGNQGEQGNIDLLSVVLHEMGHSLGLDHDDTGLMASVLLPGTREHLDSALLVGKRDAELSTG